MTLFLGGNGDDRYGSYKSDDTLYGFRGNDALYGFSGNDFLSGGIGNDYLSIIGDGSDTVKGGSGNDTLNRSYSNALFSGKGLVLNYNSVTGNGLITGGGGLTTFRHIEAFEIYGTRKKDILISGSGNDTLFGGLGNDLLNGGDGNDVLSGGGDTDTVIGGSGNDTLSAGNLFGLGVTSGITMTYDSMGGNGVLTIDQSSITFSDIEAFNIEGTKYSDTLLGGIGNDTLNGSYFGKDLLNGGDGNDSLTIGAFGPDTVIGGKGIDTLNADEYADFNNGVALFYDSLTGNGTIVADGILTTFSSIEVFNIRAGGKADTLVGGDGNDTFWTVGGDDFFNGGAGNDDLSLGVGFGQSTVLGGSGEDTLTLSSVSNRDSGIVMTYDSLAGSGTIVGRGLSAKYSGIESLNITGTEEYGDVLIGTTGNDTLNGGRLGGDDFLDGGDGNDSLIFDISFGSSTIQGGIGSDTLSIENNYSNGLVMTYDSLTGMGSMTGKDYDGKKISVTFSDVEALNISGGSFFSDTLLGSNGNDTFWGGQSATDLLDGGAGNDLLIDDGGNDTLKGGIGNDTLQHYGDSNNFLSGGSGDDYLSDNQGNDLLDGGSGNDYLSLFLSRDTVRGGEGDDTLNVSGDLSNNPLSMTYNSIIGDGVVVSNGVSLTFSSIEVLSIAGSRFADSLIAGNGKDTLNGNDGNDVLDGGSGKDFLYGAEGNDTIHGGQDNDVLFGHAGEDSLTGVSQSGLGIGEIDRFIGGLGTDTFVLASATGAFYNDSNTATSGISDYALIEDFSVNVDKIQLKSELSYVLGAVPGALDISGTGVFIDNDGIAGLSAKDELVGVLKDVTLAPGAITNTTTGFSFV